MTRSPRASSARATWKPMKPAAPVHQHSVPPVMPAPPPWNWALSRNGRAFKRARLTSSATSRRDVGSTLAGETGLRARRRRRNRPGNAQAKGPRGVWTHAGKQLGADQLSGSPKEQGRLSAVRKSLRPKGQRGRLIDVGGSSAGAPRAQESLIARSDSADALKTTPLTDAHRARGRQAWSRSPAMPCRCSIGLGVLKEHLWTREHAGAVRRLAHGPVVPRADRAQRRRGRRPSRRRRAGRAAGLRRHPRPEARPAPLHPAAQRDGRHARRPDDRPPAEPDGRAGSTSSSTPGPRTATSPRSPRRPATRPAGPRRRRRA